MTRIAQVDVPGLLARLGIKAERRGKELWATCPFHEERTASFCVRDQPGSEDRHARWRCYGACEVRGGSVVGLVMRLLDLDAREAWAWIGGEDAPPVLDVEVEVRLPREPFRLPSGVVLAPLAKWVTPARDYATGGRGLTAEQVDRWRLGYAVEGWLGGRIVLPVRDARHRLLSYTGRTFVGGTAKKWREPRVEERGDKGSVFGEEHWPPVGAERRRVAVTEAALDALAVERVAPALPVGAVYGSELMPGHVARLSTFAEVLVLSDPDPAGAKLAEQLRAALGRWSRVRRVDLPEGHDPNSLERESPEALRRLVA